MGRKIQMNVAMEQDMIDFLEREAKRYHTTSSSLVRMIVFEATKGLTVLPTPTRSEGDK